MVRRPCLVWHAGRGGRRRAGALEWRQFEIRLRFLLLDSFLLRKAFLPCTQAEHGESQLLHLLQRCRGSRRDASLGDAASVKAIGLEGSVGSRSEGDHKG